jgi:DNA ligase 4
MNKVTAEFWRIRSLLSYPYKVPEEYRTGPNLPTDYMHMDHLGSTSSSRPRKEYGCSIQLSPEAKFPLESDGIDDGTRHLMLVFFDILYIDGRSLLMEPYSTRRSMLEELILPIEGFVGAVQCSGYACLIRLHTVHDGC